MKQIRAVLCGYYGKGNAGDEALLASLLQMLPSYVTPVVLSANPQETSDRYNIESYDRMNIWSIFQAFKNADAFIWGGGSLMQDATSIRNPIYYGSLMRIAQKMGLKTIAWAQGIGPLNQELTQNITKKAFTACDSITVRDTASAQILFDWDLSCVIAPDPVWGLDYIPIKGLDNLPKPIIAVTLREHPLLTTEIIENITLALLKLQTKIKAYILFVPFQLSQDLAIAQQMQSKMRGDSQIITIEDPRELAGIFTIVDLAIGMRYHSLIMAAGRGCRCFAISYDPKVNHLMQDLYIPGWELTNIPEDLDLIYENLLECYQNNQPLSDVKIQSLKDQALLHRDVLISAL
jgi:polysaccharide pyruvyl transferase CsaB